MRINTQISTQPLKLEGLQDILSKLNIGDVIKAKVLEMTSGELLLKLFDGSVIKAAAASEIDTAPGEAIELIVKGKVDGKLIMETVKSGFQKSELMQTEIKNILQSLGFNVDSKNLQLASEIKASGLNITKELFDLTSDMLMKYSSLTPEKAIFLCSRNISPKPENINNSIKLIEGTLKLGSQFEELIEAIGKLDLNKTISILTDSATDSLQMQAVTAEKVLNNKDNALSVNAKTSLNSANPNNTDNEADFNNTANNKSINNTANNRSINNTANNRSINNTENTENMENILNATKSGIIKNNSEPENIIVGKSIKDVFVNDSIKNTYQNDSIEGAFQNDKIKNIFQNDKIKNIFQNDIDELSILKEAFKNIFIKTDSEDLRNDLNVKQLYKDILDKLEGTKNLLPGLSSAERNDITARISSIEDGITLLNQINNTNTYVQIPLSISGFNTTGELYIINKDKGRKRIDPQNAVMLIALDTRNIGHIETLIDMKGKNVSINLRAEDQKIMDFVKENYRYLYNSLSEKGYKLVDVKYRIINEKINILNAERNVKRDHEDSRVSIDLRV